MTLEEIDKIRPYRPHNIIDLDECETCFEVVKVYGETELYDCILALLRGRQYYLLFINYVNWVCFKTDRDLSTSALDKPCYVGRIETLKYRKSLL